MEPLPPAVHVASVTLTDASTPDTIWIEGNVPHFGAIVEGFASSVEHVSLGEADVHARNKFLMIAVELHGIVIFLFDGSGVIADFGMVAAQANIG